MIKKILCITLTLLMILSCMPISAIAAAAPETSGNSSSATFTIPALSSVCAVVSINSGVTPQGLTFRLTGLQSSISPASAQWSSDIVGNTAFTANYDGSGTQCMGTILFNAKTGQTFTKKTQLVKIELKNVTSTDITNKTISLAVDDFYGISGSSDMVDLSSSLLDLSIEQAATIQSITVTKRPNKTEYTIGDSGLDTTGMVITANYSDSTTKDVSNAVTLSTLDTSSAGTKNITVTLNEKPTIQTTFSVTVVAPTLTSIAVTTMPTKTSYYVGESFSTSGIKITGTYNNGTTADVTSNVTYSGFDSSSAGTKTITVTSKEKTSVKVTFSVTVSAIELTKLTVSTQPTKTSYYVGESFSTSGIKITGTYNNGTTADVTSNVTYSGFDSSSAGTKTITVTSKVNSAIKTTFTVTVTAVELTKIAVSTQPTKTSYYVGETFSTSGIKITGTYNNGTTADVTSNVTYSGFDSSSAGTKTITVTSKEKTSVKVTFSVTVSAVELTKLTVSTQPTKTSYYVGESFSTSGIKITGTYNNGTTADVTSNVTYSGFDSSSAGTKTITVTSKEKTSIKTTFSVTVSAVELTKLTVSTQPTKTSYYVGETFSTSGIKITGTYNNGTTADVTSNVTYSGFDSSSAGTKTITVTSKEKTSVKVTFSVTVSAIELTKLTVSTQPTKTSYYVGETFSTSGIKITGTYNNGTTEDVTSNVTYSGFDSSSAGTKTITVTSKEKTSVKVTFSVTVSAVELTKLTVSTQPTKTSYYVGETFSTSGIKITGTYNNGTTADVTSNVTYSGFDSSSAGTKTITVTSKVNSAVKTTFTVTVTAVELTKIAVSTQPTKTSYYVGETFSTSGIKITGTYNNGTTADVTSNVTYSGFDSSSAGTKTITVTSKEKTSVKVTFSVTVSAIELTKLTVSTKPTKTSYYVGESFSTSGIKITGTYNNGTTADVTSNVTYSGFDSSSAGTKTITVTSKEKTSVKVTFSVTVSAVELTKLTVSTQPTKTSYYVGESFSTSGIKITGTYNNGTTADVTSNVTYSGFDSSSAGTKTITVTSKEKTSVKVTFSVTVSAVELTKLTVSTQPTKTSYYIGESFSTSGIKITGTYNNGTTADVTSNVTYSGFDSSSAGTKTITVTSKVNSAVKTTFTVTVTAVELTKIAVSTQPTKTSYYVGETFSTSGIKITGTYNNGTTADVTSNVTYSGFDSSSAGTKTITVTSKVNSAIKTTFTVTVSAIELTKIEVTTKPTKTTYYVGESLNTAGAKVTGTFSDGSTADVTSSVTFGTLDSSSAGTKTITVTSKENFAIKTTFTVTVSAIELTKIEVTTKPTKTTYYVGESLNTAGAKVTGTFSDGSTSDVTSSVTFGTLDSSSAGTKTITVTSKERSTVTATFTVTVIAVELTKIEVTTKPTKTTYYVGESLNTSGIKITGTYNNGTTADVTGNVTYSALDTASAGKKTITVTSKAKTSITTTFEVTVSAVELTKLTVTVMPTKTNYYVGDELDTSGIKLTGTYNNGSAADVTANVTYSALDSTSAGTKTITVTSKEKTSVKTTFNVTVSAIELTSIVVTTLPAKTNYFVGDELDTSGIKITGMYNNGSSADVTNDVTYSGFDSSSAGAKTVTVTSKKKTSVKTTFSVTVNAVELTKIAVTAMPTKTAYYVGDTLNTSGIKVMGTYNNGTSADVTNNVTFSALDSSSAGAKTITVTSKANTSLTTTFGVTVSAVELTSIAVTSMPSKTGYYVGDTFNTSGIKITGTYNNGKTADVTGNVEYSGFDSSSAGTKTVTVASKANSTVKTTFNVTVYAVEPTGITITSLPTKTSYYIGDNALSTDGMVVTAAYNNGTTADVTSRVKCTGFDTSKAGQKSITVTLNGYSSITASFNINVAALKVVSIYVQTPPTKTDYYVGDALNTKGLVINAVYNNGSVENATSKATIGKADPSKAGRQAITVEYEGCTTSFEVNYTDLSVKSITISTANAKTDYFVGDEFDASGLTVTAEYNNGSTKDVSDSVAYSGFNGTAAGKCTVTAAYGALTAQFTVNVKAPALTELRLALGSAKLSYFVGDEFSSDGITVTAKYENNTVKDVTALAQYSGFDGKKPGTQTITVSYGGKTSSFKVNVLEITLTKVTVTAPEKTEYYTGDDLNTAGMTVTATYSDGTTADVTAQVELSGFDSTSSGTKTVTVKYGDKSDSFEVSVLDVTLERLILTAPKKRDYFVGDILNMTGFKVLAYYSNGASEIVTDLVTLSGFDSSAAGTNTVTVTYGTKSAEFTVEIADVYLESITLTPPAKTEYALGEALDISGLIVTANYSNGTSSIVTDSVSVTGYDPNTAGTQVVLVSYGSKTQIFTVEVTGVTLTGITLTPPAKRVYYAGEALELFGMTVAAAYSNGTSVIVTDDAKVSGYDPAKTGEQTVTVEYGGEKETFTVTVIEVALESITVIPPEKTSYSVGDRFDATGLIVTANYSNGTSENVTEKAELAGFDTSAPGVVNVTVSFGGEEDKFSVIVNSVEIESLSVTLPNKVEYYVGDLFDISGLIVMAELSNGTSQNVTDKVSITGFESYTSGDKVITVSYQGLSEHFLVNVIDAVIKSITVTPPQKTVYNVGDRFDTTGMSVMAKYSNGTYQDVTAMAAIKGFHTNFAGVQTITISYGGLSEQFEVTLVEAVLERVEITPPAQTSYNYGEQFSSEGMSVIAYYSDGTSADVTVLAKVSGFDTTMMGEKTVTITYGDYSESFMITVVGAVLEGIQAVPPLKTEYYIGDEMSKKGFAVYAYYNDGSQIDVTADSVISGFESETEGEKLITAEYMGYESSFTVIVDGSAELVSIEVLSPEKTEYAQGEDYYLDEVRVIAYYSDGNRLDISDTAAVAYDSSSDDVTVSYGKFSSPCAFSRLSISLVGMTVTPPKKRTYLVGDRLDLKGMTAYAEYSDGTRADVTDKAKAGGFNSAKAGKTTVTITYSGYSDTFDVNIYEREIPEVTGLMVTPPTKTVYAPGEAIDLSGMVVTAYYTNGESEDITGFASVGEIDSEEIGTHKIVVTYEGVTGSFEITIEDNSALVGDVNGDGTIDSSDALIILRYSVGMDSGFEVTTQNADLTGDGSVDSSDALAALRASIA